MHKNINFFYFYICFQFLLLYDLSAKNSFELGIIKVWYDHWCILTDSVRPKSVLFKKKFEETYIFYHMILYKPLTIHTCSKSIIHRIWINLFLNAQTHTDPALFFLYKPTITFLIFAALFIITAAWFTIRINIFLCKLQSIKYLPLRIQQWLTLDLILSFHKINKMGKGWFSDANISRAKKNRNFMIYNYIISSVDHLVSSFVFDALYSMNIHAFIPMFTFLWKQRRLHNSLTAQLWPYRGQMAIYFILISSNKF